MMGGNKVSVLSATVSLIEPANTPDAKTPASTTTDGETTPQPLVPQPKLIVLAAWMDAQEVHIAKYISMHHALFPASPILIIRCPLKHMIYPKTGQVAITAAVPVVRKYIEAEETHQPQQEEQGKNENGKEASAQAPEVLLHIFSNGGSLSIWQLFTALTTPSHPDSKPIHIPRHAIIFDSCPGSFSWSSAYAAMAAGLPKTLVVRTLAWPVLQAFIAMYTVRFFLAGPAVYGLLSTAKWVVAPFASLLSSGKSAISKDDKGGNSAGKGKVDEGGSVFKRDPLSLLAASHNTPARQAAETGGRAYVYGPADALVDYRVVESHAAAAKKAGFKWVRMERFDGSQHVAHMRKDPEKYWEVVRETWGRWWVGR